MLLRLRPACIAVLMVLSGMATFHSRVLAETQTYPLDLADPISDTPLHLAVAQGRVILHLKSRAPGGTYSIKTIREAITIDRLEAPSPNSLQGFAQSGMGVLKESECAREVTQAWTRISAEGISESGIRSELVKLTSSLTEAGCSLPAAQAFERAVRALTESTQEFWVAAGERVTVMIIPNSVEKPTTWTVVFEGPSRGQWLTTYGFVFPQDRDQLFFAQATDSPDRYLITRESPRKAWLRVPALFFTWLPEAKLFQDYSVGPTAGFGATSDNFAVFMGLSVVHNLNVQLSLGGAVYPQRRLLGRYRDGQEVQENLSEAQLHSNVFNSGWYGALSFRFASNPFKNVGDSDTDTATKQ